MAATKPKLFIRADGGTSIGMGHVIRSLALAEMLKLDFDITFVLQETDASVYTIIEQVVSSIIRLPVTTDYEQDADKFIMHIAKNDLVVLDGYHFKTDYQQTIKNNCFKLICIDDLHAWHQVADVVINHADGVTEKDYEAEAGTKFCLGLDYILLRKPFLNAPPQTKITKSIKKVFISMGAADVNNITQKFLQALVQLKFVEEIDLMLGAINPHLKTMDEFIAQHRHVNIVKHFNISATELCDLLQKCDVAICPASSISYECCAVGIPLLTGYTAENQQGILSGLLQHKVAYGLGDLNVVSIEKINEKVRLLNVVADGFAIIREFQQKLIDGKSPERLLQVFKNLMPIQLNFRFANVADVDLYFNWANDETVRSNSFNQNAITFDKHVSWFFEKLRDDTCFFYLFMNKNEPVGQVRIQKGDETVIGISIAAAYRGKSLATPMLQMACDDFHKKYPDESIVAYIKVENIASYTGFKKAGFADMEQVTVMGFTSYKLIKKYTQHA